MNQSLINLILILSGGGLIIGFGYYFQSKALKKKKEEMEIMQNNYGNNSTNDNELNEEEITIKNYIEQYKNSYSKEQIKSALMSSGNSEEMINKLLEKYY